MVKRLPVKLGLVMSEEDTFKALTRGTFESVILNMSHSWETFNNAYCNIITSVGASIIKQKPSHDWSIYSEDWKFEDFVDECVKRYKEHEAIQMAERQARGELL